MDDPTKVFPNIGLGPQDVNDLPNLMTLDASVHRDFGSFNITLEATVCHPLLGEK